MVIIDREDKVEIHLLPLEAEDLFRLLCVEMAPDENTTMLRTRLKGSLKAYLGDVRDRKNWKHAAKKIKKHAVRKA